MHTDRHTQTDRQKQGIVYRAKQSWRGENFMKAKLTDIPRTNGRWSFVKIMRVKDTRAIKRSGPVLLAHLYVNWLNLALTSRYGTCFGKLDRSVRLNDTGRWVAPGSHGGLGTCEYSSVESNVSISLLCKARYVYDISVRPLLLCSTVILCYND